MEIFIWKNGNQAGPFSEEQVLGMVSAGLASTDDLAWVEGATSWQPLSGILRLSRPPPIPQTSESQVTRPRSGPHGVAGWLAFFCFGLTVSGPFYTIFQMTKNWELAQPLFSRFPFLKSAVLWENIGTSALLVYGFVIGCMIWSGSPSGRRMAKQFLLVHLFASVCISMGSFLFMGTVPKQIFDGIIASLIGVTIREGIFFAIWWTYFKKSKRVKNTYGDE